MLICNKCKTPVQIKTNYKVVSNFFLSFTGVTLTELEIVKPEEVEYGYYCPNCDQELEITQLETKCYLCSQYVMLDNSIVVKGRGNYHKECAEAYFKDEPSVSLKKLLEKGIKTNEQKDS